MRVFFVTGVSGAGKSTLARRLAEWGHRTVSMDGDSRLCSWVDVDGRRVQRPSEPDAGWLSDHEWRWDPDRLDEIISRANAEAGDPLWLFGHATNAVDFVDRFDATLLLEIDQRTMIARMSDPRRGNDFGRVGDSLAAALASYTSFVATWRRNGATIVDASRDIDTVAEDLLMAAALSCLREE